MRIYADLVEAVDTLIGEAHLKTRDLALHSIEATIAATLRKAWAAQCRGLLIEMETRRKWFKEAINPDDVPLPSLDSVRGVWDPLPEAIAQGVLSGAQTVLAETSLSSSFSLANERAYSFAQAHAADLVTQIDSTTRNQLRDVIDDSMVKGYSYDRTASRIRDTFDHFSEPSPLGHIRDRAELVSVTESAFAYENGQAMMVDELSGAGIGMEKSWLGAGNACSICMDNEGEGWIASDQDYPNGVQTPPAHPGCRCGNLYRRAVISEEQMRDAVDWYQDSGDAINRELRAGIPNDFPYEHLDAAIAQSRIDYDAVTYRAVHDTYLLDARIGDTFVEKGYVSVGTNHAVAAEYVSETGKIIEVEIPSGSRALSTDFMNPSSADQWGMKEYLLARDSRFEVIGVDPVRIRLLDVPSASRTT